MNETERDQLETSARDFAAQIGLEYFDTRPRIDITDLSGRLTVEGMKAYGVVPLGFENNTFTLGAAEHTDRGLLEPLRARLTGFDVIFRYISQYGWQRLFNRYQVAEHMGSLDTGDFEEFTSYLANLEPKFMFEPVAQLAYALRASDIHVEAASDSARIRFRIDGTLHPILTLAKQRYDLFVSDLQMRGGVKWGADVPQGGRLTIPIINDDGDEVPLNMRLETIPSLHGQDVVVRLFNLTARYLSLKNLHMTEEQEKVLRHASSRPRGLVLAVGPTGSGKTSTLYSLLNELSNPQIKTVTLEDPVEYELSGVSQIPVRSEDQQLFLDKLRAVLREDPNIIMIGEIRDADTARTALQAALTGHLVLSTFHAATAAAAITRLMDMIGQNPLLASSVRLIMAQRLVRELCQICRESYKPSKEELLEIKTALHGLPASMHPPYDEISLNRSVGCDTCHGFGFKGRFGLMEQLVISPKIEELIASGTAATTAQTVQAAAIREGMITLLQDGVLKAVSGRTTLNEIYAAVGE